VLPLFGPERAVLVVVPPVEALALSWATRRWAGSPSGRQAGNHGVTDGRSTRSGTGLFPRAVARNEVGDGPLQPRPRRAPLEKRIEDPLKDRHLLVVGI
jgi:hypothetical protein